MGKSGHIPVLWCAQKQASPNRLLLVFVVLLWFLLQSCAMPQRTGYDRNIGGYRRTAAESSQTASKQTKPTQTKSKDQAETAKSTKDDLQSIIEPWLGTPYRFGGSSRSGTDCSGFVMQVFKKWKNIALPHSTRQSWKMGKSVRSGSLQRGDVVFFGNFWNVNHNGIYLGNNQFVHASSSRGVMISDLFDEGYWEARYKGARRY